MCKTCKNKGIGAGQSLGDIFSNIDWKMKGSQAIGAIGGNVIHGLIIEKAIPYIKKDADTKTENMISGAIGLFMPEIMMALGVEDPYMVEGVEAAGTVIFGRSVGSLSAQIAEKIGIKISGIDDNNISGPVSDLPYIPTETNISGNFDDPNIGGMTPGVQDGSPTPDY